MTTVRSNLLVIELMLLTEILIWTANQTLGKLAMREMSPSVYTSLRFALATPSCCVSPQAVQDCDKRFDPDFRRDSVHLHINGNCTCVSLAEELNLHLNTVCKLRRQQQD